MTQEILHIDFLLGSRKDEFDLLLVSRFSNDVGGIPWTNTYTIVVDSDFYEFWDYVRSRYSVNSRDLMNPISAKIIQQNPGIDTKGYPWINSLVIEGSNQTETTIFFPHTCGLKEEVEAEEYREYVSSLTELTNNE